MNNNIRHGTPYKTAIKNGKQRHLHTIIAENALGRSLTKDEVVHHLNDNKRDNRLENLLIVTKAWHKRVHSNIGLATRFKKIHNFRDQEAYDKYVEYRSAIKAAKKLGCTEVTIRRAVKRVTGKKLDEIAKDNNWGIRSMRWV